MGIDYSDEIKYNQTILDEIEGSYKLSNIIPFIGSGFSKNANENYPDWSKFIDTLSEEEFKNKNYLKEKFPGTEYLIRSADYTASSIFHNQFPMKPMRDKDGRSKLKQIIYQKIKDSVGGLHYDDSQSHELLLKLDKCNIYFTTNWDNLLEKIAKDKGILIKAIHDITHLKEIAQNGDKKILIKMHGCIESPENIIVSETDYFELLNNKNHPINIKFQNELFHKDFLFLGFSFTDPNISNLSFPAYIIKKDEFNVSDEPKIFLISFSDYDPVLARFFIELRGIYLLFLDVPKKKYKHSIIAFLEYLTGSNDNIKKIINKTNDTYKTEMKDELSESVTTINEKIGLFSSNKDNPDYSHIKEDLESKIKELEYKKKVIDKKLKKIN